MIRSSFSLSESALRDCRSRIGIGYCKLYVGANDLSWIICSTVCIGNLVFHRIWRSPCSSKRTFCLADGREGTADAIQKKKNWVACHVSVMLSRSFVRACVEASQEGMISSIGKTFMMKYHLQTNRPRISVQVVCDTQIASSLWWGCIFLLQFMGGSAILNSSGMVNDFKECTARILIWQNPGLLGLFAVFIYSYRRK